MLRAEYPDPAEMKGLEQDIFGYLKYLKASRKCASVESVLNYLHDLETQGRRTDTVRVALRWFFQVASQQKTMAGLADAREAENPEDVQPVIEAERIDREGSQLQCDHP